MHHCHFSRHGGHGHGLGRFGRGFMDGGAGGRSFGMGRKLASGDLQLLILSLLDQKPRHGYEIIKALDEKSRGFYVPSPGMVYPALTYLEEIGHATIATDGTRKLYHVTHAGREHLAKHRTAADALLAQFERVGERMDRVRRVMSADDGGEATAEPSDHSSEELLHAWRGLKMALANKWDSPREEQQRVADILNRATAAIVGEGLHK